MVQRSVRVASSVGLHARPAAVFVTCVRACGLPVTIRKADLAPVAASSILAVIALDVAGGDEVILEVDGERAGEVLDRLVELLGTDLEPQVPIHDVVESVRAFD